MNRSIQETSVFQLSHDAVLETFDDGALILSVKDLGLTELNATARDILASTDGIRTTGQAASILAKQYDIDASAALRDVLELYQQLVRDKIIEEVQQFAREE